MIMTSNALSGIYQGAIQKVMLVTVWTITTDSMPLWLITLTVHVVIAIDNITNDITKYNSAEICL